VTPLYCWGCHSKIGETDGARIVIVTACGLTLELRQTTPIHCGCGGATLWRRHKAREDVAPLPALCYAERVEV